LNIEINKCRFLFPNLYYNIQKCLSACLAIDSAPGHDRGMTPVPLEPEGPDGVQREQNFTKK
jgi:hypothetical protein